MVSTRCALFELLLIVGVSLATEPPTGEDIVKVDVNGVEFQAPYYEPGEKPLSEEAIKFYNGIAFDTLQIGLWLVNSAIDDNLDYVDDRGISKISRLLELKKYSKRFAEEHNLKDDQQFETDMLQIFDSVIEKKYLKKSSILDCFGPCKDKEPSKKYLLRLELIFRGAYRLAFNSPVGPHLDYRKMTVDGSLVTDELKEIFRHIYKAKHTLERHHILFEFINAVQVNLRSNLNRRRTQNN